MDCNDNNKEYVTINARYVRTIHEDDINGFCIFLCDVIAGPEASGKGETMRIKGYHLPSIKKVFYQYTGVWETDKNGKVFVVTSFSLELPTSKENIIEFLSSPLIKKVGPKIAGNIYDKFKEDTFYIIEHDYKRLTEVKGIKEQKALSIHENFMESKAVNIIYSLLGTSFTFAHATKIFTDCKGLQQAVDMISNKPYRLIHYRGITFKMVDELGKKYLNNPNDAGRIVVAGQCVLENFSVHGNVGMPVEEFLKQTEIMLNGEKSAYSDASERVERVTIQKAVGRYCATNCDAVKKGTAFVYENKIVFKAKNAQAEQYIATKLKRLNTFYSAPTDSDGAYLIEGSRDGKTRYTLDELIEEYENSSSIALDDVQKAAVKQCFTSGVSIITGGPGTGKSTTMKAVLFIQNKINAESKVTLLAPTGRAAKRLSEATGAIATTIHSALHIIPDEDNMSGSGSCADTDVALDSDLVVVDEMSMTDMSVMYSLCKSVEVGTRLVLVGDEEQLPSVGPGNILHDLIHSDVIPTVKLRTIFRQTDGSSIIENANKINSGVVDLKFDNDFKFIPVFHSNRCEELKENRKLYHSSAVQKIVNLYARAVSKFGMDNVILLVPYRKKGYMSVNNLNPIIQHSINESNISGPFAKYGENRFYVNDRVMQTKNIKMSGEDGKLVYISNGEIGYVSNIYSVRDEDSQKEETKVVVDFNGQKVTYSKDMLQTLDLAYCQTVHKAQGAEYKIVLFGLMNEHSRMLKKRVLYTGVTRGKEFVCLVGEQVALNKAIGNSDEEESRVTLLCERLQGKAS